MALEFLQGPHQGISRLSVFPGTFNPPTRAHLALAHAALAHSDEVLFVLPRSLPHKQYDGVGFQERLGLLRKSVAASPEFAVAASGGGLFLDIAEECREAYGPGIDIAFLCGKDAAERIVGWPYDREDALEQMFLAFSLLVARRQGEYAAPEALAERIRCIEIGAEWDSVSATDVRERIAAGREWRHLVPPVIALDVMRLYSSK